MKTKTKETVERMCRYAFTLDEIKKMGSQLATECTKLSEIEDEKKQAVSEYKSKIDACNTSINSLSHKIQTGSEMRRTSCYEEKDFKKKVRTFIDIESGKVIDEIKMTEEDMQLNTNDKPKK